MPRSSHTLVASLAPEGVIRRECTRQRFSLIHHIQEEDKRFWGIIVIVSCENLCTVLVQHLHLHVERESTLGYSRLNDLRGNETKIGKGECIQATHAYTYIDGRNGSYICIEIENEETLNDHHWLYIYIYMLCSPLELSSFHADRFKVFHTLL